MGQVDVCRARRCSYPTWDFFSNWDTTVTQPCRFPATERWCTARAMFGISWPGMTARESLRARLGAGRVHGRRPSRRRAAHFAGWKTRCRGRGSRRRPDRLRGRSMLPAATSRESQLMEPGPGALRGRRTDGKSREMTGGAFTDSRSMVFVTDVSGAAPRIRLTDRATLPTISDGRLTGSSCSSSKPRAKRTSTCGSRL